MRIFTLSFVFYFLSIFSIAHANEITLVSPQDNSVLTDVKVPLSVNITDPSQVERVTYRINAGCWDSSLPGDCLDHQKGNVGETSVAPFNLNFTATNLDNGTNYVLTACAYLKSGVGPICDEATNLTIQHSEPTVHLKKTFASGGIRRKLPEGTFPPVKTPTFPIWHNFMLLGMYSADEDGIQDAKFYIDDGILVGSGINSASFENYYSLVWNATVVRNGWHRIYVEATDNTGLTSRDDPNVISRGLYYIENQYIPTNLYGRAKVRHVNVIWSGHEDDKEYAVYRRLDTETAFVYLGNTPHPILVDDMPEGTTFAEYKVQAVYEYSTSGFSEPVTVYATSRRRR